MIQRIGWFALISLTIYLVIAVVLILTDRPVPRTVSENGSIAFDALTTVDYTHLPELRPYTARDDTTLYYRLYESSFTTNKVLVLLHGSGWHSMQFYPLAVFIRDNDLAHVITPDLRGHGFETEQRGDVDYIGQLEDDLADLIAMAKRQFPGAVVIVGGHSSGGGLAVRFAGGRYGSEADAYLLLAPFLKYNAPTTRPNSGGWARPLSRCIAGLTMINNLGIRWFNDLTVIQFNMPQAVLEGPLGESATTSYSYRLNTSFAPRSNYVQDLSAMQQPFLLVAGAADEYFIADQYESTISAYTNSGSYVVLPDVGHVDLMTTSLLEPVLAGWFLTLDR